MADRERDEEKGDKGFRVVDRRRFTSEGEPRAGVPAEPTPTSEPIRPLGEAKPEPPPAAPTKGRRDKAAAEPKGRPSAEVPAGIDFIGFAASLATNALAAMGALPEAQAQGLPRSLLEGSPERCLRIPMAAEARSLNLAVSVAVAAYESRRQCSKSPLPPGEG